MGRPFHQRCFSVRQSTRNARIHRNTICPPISHSTKEEALSRNTTISTADRMLRRSPMRSQSLEMCRWAKAQVSSVLLERAVR